MSQNSTLAVYILKYCCSC